MDGDGSLKLTDREISLTFADPVCAGRFPPVRRPGGGRSGWRPNFSPASFRGPPACPCWRQPSRSIGHTLRTRACVKKTLQKYDKVFQRLQALADKRRVTKISGINLELVAADKARRVDDQAAAKTIYTETVVIRQLVNFALTRKLITADPLGELKLKKPKPRPQPCWTKKRSKKSWLPATSRNGRC